MAVAVASSAKATSWGVESAPTIRPSFALKARQVRRLKLVADRAHRTLYEPTRAEYERRITRISHVEVAMECGNAKGEPIIFSTAETAHLQTASAIVDDPRTPGSPIHRASRKLVAAEKWRERERARIMRQTGLVHAIERSNRASNLYCDALSSFAAMPSQSLAEIGLKLRLIRELDDPEEYAPELIEDIHFLSMREA